MHETKKVENHWCKGTYKIGGADEQAGVSGLLALCWLLWLLLPLGLGVGGCPKNTPVVP